MLFGFGLASIRVADGRLLDHVLAQHQSLRQREQQHQPDTAEELEVDPGGGAERVRGG